MFIDTNALIYSTRPSSSFDRRAVAALAKAARLEPRLVISRQVMREYLAVVTRPGGGSEPILAPTEGIVTNLQLAVGAHVEVGVPVMTLIDTADWRMVANLPQNALSRIAPGQTAELTLDMYPGRVFTGTVESINWGVSTGQGLPSGQLPAVAAPQNWIAPSQRFPVRLRLDDRPDDLPLRVGATGIVTFYTGGGPLMAGLAQFRMRLRSLLAYLY